MTRHFPQWLNLGLCGLPAPGRDGVLSGTLRIPSPPAETVAKRTVGTKKSHGGPCADRMPGGAAGDPVVCPGVVLERMP